MSLFDRASLIVTGFGLFGDHDYNPSTDAARSLADTAGGELRLLPVAYGAAAPFAETRLRATGGPILLIHLGLGSRRSEICFERRARNFRSSRPDSRERRTPFRPPSSGPLVDESRRRHTTDLGVDRLVEQYNAGAAGELPEARVSRDCGTYVCNALYYHSLKSCRRHRRSGRAADALFVHLPQVGPDRARRLGERLASVLT